MPLWVNVLKHQGSDRHDAESWSTMRKNAKNTLHLHCLASTFWMNCATDCHGNILKNRYWWSWPFKHGGHVCLPKFIPLKPTAKRAIKNWWFPGAAIRFFRVNSPGSPLRNGNIKVASWRVMVLLLGCWRLGSLHRYGYKRRSKGGSWVQKKIFWKLFGRSPFFYHFLIGDTSSFMFGFPLSFVSFLGSIVSEILRVVDEVHELRNMVISKVLNS